MHVIAMYKVEAAAIFDAADIDAETGIATFHAHRAADIFYNDCDAEQAAWATAKLRPFPLTSLSGVTAEPWRNLDNTYVVCTEDRTVPANLQRAMSLRARKVLEFPTGHSPFLSRPDLVTELLEPLARDS
jgi:pimeloyl-ACP methyl ester carboxylesterase